jgi:hypothetical protein
MATRNTHNEQPPKKSTCEGQSFESAIVDRLTMFYGVMGHMPEVVGALAYMAKTLCAQANYDQIIAALGRCTLECTYPVRLPDIIKRIPGNEVSQAEANARKAWDVLVAFVKKYVSNDIHGNYGPEHGWYSKSFPKLDDRILDSVRRTGGWKTYARLFLPMEARRPEEDLPFQQKRFYEEYMAWTAVERIPDAAHILETFKQPKYMLVGKPPVKMLIHQGNVPISEPATVHTMDKSKMVKSIPEPKTEAEIRDRRMMLKQQAEQLAKRHS